MKNKDCSKCATTYQLFTLATNVDGISRAGGSGRTLDGVPEVVAAIMGGSRSLASLSAEDMVATVEMKEKVSGAEEL